MQNNLFPYVTWHGVQPLSSNRLKTAFKSLNSIPASLLQALRENVGDSLPLPKGICHKALCHELFDFRLTLTHISQLRCFLQMRITWRSGCLTNNTDCHLSDIYIPEYSKIKFSSRSYKISLSKYECIQGNIFFLLFLSRISTTDKISHSSPAMFCSKHPLNKYSKVLWPLLCRDGQVVL